MPTTISKYTLGKTLGEGWNSKVKAAEDADGNKYAIKIMNKEDAEN